MRSESVVPDVMLPSVIESRRTGSHAAPLSVPAIATFASSKAAMVNADTASSITVVVAAVSVKFRVVPVSDIALPPLNVI